MSAVEVILQGARRDSRAKRARVFREAFAIGPSTRILDIASGDGASIAALLAGSGAQPKNVYIADYDAAQVQQGHRNFGFVPVTLADSGQLPFEDDFFDIVHCAWVIEHVAMVDADAWSLRSEEEFHSRTWESQRQLADEIQRVGKGYYVQTPEKWFPLHTHSWVPFIDYLSRPMQLRVLSVTNRYSWKPVSPTWSLLTSRDMQELFPEAEIRRERILGLTKSILAVKT